MTVGRPATQLTGVPRGALLLTLAAAVFAPSAKAKAPACSLHGLSDRVVTVMCVDRTTSGCRLEFYEVFYRDGIVDHFGPRTIPCITKGFRSDPGDRRPK